MNASAWRSATRRLSPPYEYLSLSGVRRPRACILNKWLDSRGLRSHAPALHEAAPIVPLRKHLKDEAKRKKLSARLAKGSAETNQVATTADTIQSGEWELTVGIEVHAELNTASKLFSSASTAGEDNEQDTPNTRVAHFDAALPGAQPQFQVATLLPAVRAALALNCTIQRKSSWDRKHYFHWDQPNGYQITQYYEPFAKDGLLKLRAEDGVPEADLNGAEELCIGIKQVQMEQDTAKTTNIGSASYHIDLNRAGHPLIEIITWPQIHSPQTAAAAVRKITATLRSVDACVAGMEIGGLRADVNVSVRKRDSTLTEAVDSTACVTSSYGAYMNLGQRTEIKNLSSFKAVEDAIIAERDRQIRVLDSGGIILGETRGWTLGATETTRLRGKEGEVDYRYMPDADLPPLRIGQDLIDHLSATLPPLPHATVSRLTEQYGLSTKDARTLATLDDGDRLDFMEATVMQLHRRSPEEKSHPNHAYGKLASNWVLHELGGLLTSASQSWADMHVTASDLADILAHLQSKTITARSAKHLLAILFRADRQDTTRPSVAELIDEQNLRLRPLSETEYEALVQSLMDANPDMVHAIREKGQRGKIMWFVGQMVRTAEEGTVEPDVARRIAEKMLG